MDRCPKDEPTAKNLVCKKAIHIPEKNWKNLLVPHRRVNLFDSNVLKFVEEEKPDGILFAADIGKVFDAVHRYFLFASLKKFGF